MIKQEKQAQFRPMIYLLEDYNQLERAFQSPPVSFVRQPPDASSSKVDNIHHRREEYTGSPLRATGGFLPDIECRLALLISSPPNRAFQWPCNRQNCHRSTRVGFHVKPARAKIQWITLIGPAVLSYEAATESGRIVIFIVYAPGLWEITADRF